jgi:hypothetical protein
MAQRKMGPGKLLDEQGHLIEKGYATSLVREYDRQAIKAGQLRIKEWDYYLVMNEDFGIALTIADNAYIGMGSVSWLDFRQGTEHTLSFMNLLTMGRTHLPASSANGNVTFHKTGCDIAFINDQGRRRLTARVPDFDAGQPIDFEVDLGAAPADSMVIATPFAGHPKAFYYNQKILGMPASGHVTYNGQLHHFTPDRSWGLLDWGRGVWTFDNTWYWGAGQGLVQGRHFGFNIGGGFGDTAAATENMLFDDGRAHKLESVSFKIPVNGQGTDDYLQPWTISSSDQRFEMIFTPLLDRKALTSLGPLQSDQHQVFGYYDGVARLDDGRTVELQHFLGFVEKVRNKW